MYRQMRVIKQQASFICARLILITYLVVTVVTHYWISHLAQRASLTQLK